MIFFDIQGIGIEEYGPHIPSLPICGKQLSKGIFNFSSTVFMGDCSFAIRSVSQDIEEKVTIPHEETLFIIPLTPTPISVCNRISTEAAIPFLRGGDIFHRHLPGGTVINGIRIKDSHITKYYPDDFSEHEKTTNKAKSGYMHAHKKVIAPLTTSIFQLFNIYLKSDDVPRQIAIDTQDYIQRAMIALTFRDTQTNIRINSQKRWVDKAIELIQDNSNKNYTISELAYCCGVSPRGLQHAFKKILGTPPKKYLLQSRLKKIRYRLLNDETPYITKIAQDFGVTHMGNFSREYRILFGETPSDTLSKNRY